MAITKEKQKQEALERMKILQLHENAIKEFDKKGILNKSELRGFLYYLSKEEEGLVRKWEKESGNLAYHAILTHTPIGTMLSILYVSQYEDDWEKEKENLKRNMAIAYVMNLDDDWCSEYGNIGFERNIGGLIRTF